MLLARRNNDSDWLSNFFDDTLFNTEVMSRMNATAPAINIKETDKNYIMEVAAPGLKKEWVRVIIPQREKPGTPHDDEIEQHLCGQ